MQCYLSEKISTNLQYSLISFLPTVPLSNPILTVLPDIAEISEGDHLHLICGVSGTPPVTFKWYRSDKEYPVHVITCNLNNTDYQIPVLSGEDSGRYRCEAVNYANNIVYSDFVDIQGEKTSCCFFPLRYDSLYLKLSGVCSFSIFSIFFPSVTKICLLLPLINNNPSHTKFQRHQKKRYKKKYQ